MGDMNFPDPNTTTEFDGWEWDSEKWTKWGSGGSGGDNTTSKTAIASGVMATGDMVVLNADGTVSVVEGSVTPGGGIAAELGEKVEFYVNQSSYITSAYDANTGKIVVAYRDGNNGFGTAVAGRISGDTIVFETPVVFNSSSSLWTSVCYDQLSDRFVFAFIDSSDSSKGKAVVGKVSVNTINFDLAAQIDSETTLVGISATYDSSVGKVVITYSLNVGGGKAVVGSIVNGAISFGSPSSFQTENAGYIASAYDPISESTIIVCVTNKAGRALAGKVIGNSITFGTHVVFDTEDIKFTSVAYDQASKKMVIAYISGGAKKGRLVVCTVSGGIINCGAPVDFADIPTNTTLMVRGDPVMGKVVIVYMAGSGFQGYAIAGEVSGDSATFEDALQFEGGNVFHPALCFDTRNEKFGLFYFDDTNKHSEGRVYSPGLKLPDIVDTNLTSDNFIGVSKGNYADGDEATVQTAGINADQQGMTAGKQYVQPDGTLDTTKGTPSVSAGTALSATELNIKDTV
jgi:hypothetical protein